MANTLTQKKCTPCQGGIPPLTPEQIKPFMDELADEWELVENKKIRRQYEFPKFTDAVAFINRVADLAEEEGHHPDIILHYNKLTFELWTHKINGLFDNDFILAAKIDELYQNRQS